MLCTAVSKPRVRCTINYYQAGRVPLLWGKLPDPRALPALQGLDPRPLPEEATELTLPQDLLLPACYLSLSGDLGREATTLKPFRAREGDECKGNPGLLGEH